MVASDWVKHENDKNFKNKSHQCVPYLKAESVQPLQSL